jgi:NADPH-ferrihemoprotein reductase
MIGPGTGIAPMRALLQDRQWQGQQYQGAGVAGKNTLYFGCQRRDTDYIYREELEAFVSSKVLSNLHLAFSRETEQKVYVQHLLREVDNARDIVTDLDQGGYVYVCGGTKMGSDVMEALVDVLVEHKTMKRELAVGFVKQLQKSGRYVQELWSA